MKPLAIDEFCNLIFLSDVAFAPDGSKACYVLTKALKEENKYCSWLYIYENGIHRQLTWDGQEKSFCWLDKDTILFPVKQEDEKDDGLTSRYYKISASGGKAASAFSFPIPTEKVFPLKNGDLLVLGTVYPGFEKLYTGNTELAEAYRKYQEENEDYEVINQSPWWWNEGTFTRGAYKGLYYYDHETQKLSWLTEPGFQVSEVRLSKDQSTVYYSLMDVSVPQPAHFGGAHIYRMNLESKTQECVCCSREGFVITSYELGDSFLLILAHDGKFGINTDPDFFTLDYQTLQVRPYVRHGESIGSSICTDVRSSEEYHSRMVGDTYYFVSTRFDSAPMFKLEKGKILPVIARSGSIDCFDAYGEKLLMVALWDLRGQELYDENGCQVSHFNDTALEGKFLSKPEPFNIVAGDHDVHGFVMKPFGYEPGKKYPVILDIHGGPKCAYGDVLFHETQYWAGRGYFVIFCNPTGSDGRGAFMNILGKYGTVDYEDIMAFCDQALTAYPDMDADNLFETGGSYGGYMTNWIIGHTDRFRACVSQRSISNWTSFFGVSDIGFIFAEDQNKASVWPDAEKLWWHSPMKYADQCKTPTLFLHSFEDYRCPIDQGYQMYAALVANGVESKMVLFKGENHELSRTGKPKHRIRRLKEITEWFDIHRK